MIKVTYRGYPTMYTSNQSQTYPNLEVAIRKSRELDMICVAIEEPNKGWHKVPLNKLGHVEFGTYGYGTPSGGTMHYSKDYKEIEAKLKVEKEKPKLL
jgi:hypothetical protein